jgi:hypothetical protein
MLTDNTGIKIKENVLKQFMAVPGIYKGSHN